MSVPLPARSPALKPSGALTYRQSQGADVWPGVGDIAFVRVLDGKLVIFQEFMENDKVAVSVGGQDRVLTRSEWRALPAYKD